MARLIERHTGHGYRVEGVLLVEYVDHTRSFGSELFVGLRSTREFGPVIAAGLGGLETEYLASKLRPGSAAAKALATETSAERFFELFRNTAAYEVLSGQVRGHRRVVADDALLRCFRAFIAIARRFCVAGGPSPAGIVELEVNPFAFVDGRIIPLDGRGRLGLLTKPAAPRPLHNMSALLEPQAIAVAGVSGSRRNFGRIILDNIKASGFPVQRLYAIKDQAEPIDGVRCVRDVADLPEVADLLVAATAADRVPALIEQVVNHQKARSVILIPGGLGEVQGTRVLGDRIRDLILASRSQPGGGPLVLGGNSLGVRSHPGRYDTFFITEEKLGPRPLAPCRLALVSQSGGFMISRMSNLAHLEPRIAVSVGNQIDLTLSDVLRGVGGREDVDCVGVYVEGFNDLDGLDFVRAVRQLTSQGKLIVFYKAGRTPPGKSATRGHTASIAGDYDVCQAAVAEAGALVTDTFKEFEQLLELGACLHGKRVGGRRLAAISNGGFESVGMADAILGARYQLEMAQLSDPTKALLQEALTACGLHSLVTAGNPLDLTPMADDEAYENCIRAMLQAQEVDALVVSCVPMTTQLLTLPDEIERTGSIAARLPHLAQWSDKPLVFVVDCGEPFEALARRVRQAGVPVFRSCDQAVRSLGRYLCHRSAGQSGEDTPSAVARADADSGRGRQAHALSKCAAAARR
jgi:acyl-CoA synthetase (NDP forming)